MKEPKRIKRNEGGKTRGLNVERDHVSVSLSRINHVAGAEARGILFVLWFSVLVTK